VALIMLAFVLFAADCMSGSRPIGGVISLVAGGLLLTSTSNSDFQVSRWLIVATGAVCLVFFFTVVTAIIRMRRMPAYMGTQSMIGTNAIARSDLRPDGFVFLHGERWKAIAEDGPISEGEPVKITSVKGLTLTVRRRT
jgi:membrane-bound serine protease (ClpP class)